MESSSWRSTLELSGNTHYPIPGHSRLSNDEAMYLYQRWNDHGDTRAKNYLISAKRRHAIAIALTYCRYGLPLAGLIAAGEAGLLRAIETFDAQCDQRFSTYTAYLIRLGILDQVLSSIGHSGADATPLSLKDIRKLRRERARIIALSDGLRATERTHTAGVRARGARSLALLGATDARLIVSIMS